MRRILPALLFWIVLAQGVPVLAADYTDPWYLSLVGTHITDNGDGDGFADTNETLQIGVSLLPRCQGCSDQWLVGCVAWLSTDSPAVDCVRRSDTVIGDLSGIALAVTPVETFEIKIGNIDRHDLGLGPDDPLDAVLALDIRCVAGSDALWFRELLPLQLDLNVSDQGQSSIVWKEDFEGGGTNPADPFQGTGFFAQNLDAGLPGNNNTAGLFNSDGWRCQYSDPDWQNSASYNHAEGVTCYPAMNLAHANAVFWQVDGSLVTDSPDGGRAYRGEKSMYYGVFLGQPDENFTTPLSTVESAATVDVINLGVGAPELSFFQQISLADHRSVNARYLRSIDRGVVQIQLHDAAGDPISDWMNLQPVQNSYDQQAEDNYFNCMFDPVDDGNNEDDFFDPTDPYRDDGPSSTCYPGFAWSFMGSTTEYFSAAYVGYGTTPPDPSNYPSLGLGTWVESIIDLSEFKGRRAKLRYLVTSLKATAETHVGQFGPDRDERDDGWWIDEIEITDTLSNPATFHNDRFLLGTCAGTGQSCIGQCRWSLAPCSDGVSCGDGEGDCVIPCPSGDVCVGPPPDCGVNCTEAQLNLFVEPYGSLNPESVATSEPGEPVTVNLAAPVDLDTGAEPSWVDACIDGHREYRFCISGDPDGDLSGLPDTDCDDAWDSPICDSCTLGWCLENTLFLSPDAATTYAMEVRCSTVPDCRDGRTLEILVECPSDDPNTLGLREMRPLDTETLTWGGRLDVDWLRGSFSTSTDIGDYVADFTDVASYATSIPMDGDPPAGSGYYYLVKADGATPPSPFQWYNCDTSTWRSGGYAEMREPARNNAFGDP